MRGRKHTTGASTMTQPLGQGALGALRSANTMLRRAENHALNAGDGTNAANLHEFFNDPSRPRGAATLQALTGVFDSMGPRQQQAFLNNLTTNATAPNM